MPTKDRLNKIKSVAKARQEGVLVFEDIHDPHNAAAVLRTAEGLGFQKVCFIQTPIAAELLSRQGKDVGPNEIIEKMSLIKDGAGFMFEKVAKFNPKKVGKASSATANKWLDFEIFSSTKDCFKKLKKQGFKIMATVLDGKAKPLNKINFRERKIALVFGNEHKGLSETAIKMSDEHIYIPMQGFVQSFNISVTAAICLYEMFRQRQISPKKFLLNKTASAKLVKLWKNK